MTKRHAHYSAYKNDDVDTYYINHLFYNEGESFARRETIYDGLSEAQVDTLLPVLEANAQFLVGYAAC